MYNPPSGRPPQVREDDLGINAPLIHQQIISRLHFGLSLHYYQQLTIPYEPLTETMLGEESSPTPDLALYDASTEQFPVIIEICGTWGFKSDMVKVINLVDGDLYGIGEAFVYNYKTGQWLRYRKGDGGVATETAFSEVLGLDLSAFL